MRNCVLCGEKYNEKDPEAACDVQLFDSSGGKVGHITHLRSITLDKKKGRLNLCPRCVKAFAFAVYMLKDAVPMLERSLEMEVDEDNLYVVPEEVKI